MSARDLDQVPFCCLIAESGAVGGAAACWQVLAACRALCTESPPVCALLFLETQESSKRKCSQDLRSCISSFEYPKLSSTAVDLSAWVSSSLTATPSRNSSPEAPAPPLLFLDSLDAAIVYHGIQPVCLLLASLLRDRQVAGIISLAHSSLGEQRTAALKQLATCLVVVKPASSLQSDVVRASCGRAVHTQANALTLRHSGAPPDSPICPLQTALSVPLYPPEDQQPWLSSVTPRRLPVLSDRSFGAELSDTAQLTHTSTSRKRAARASSSPAERLPILAS